MLKLVINSPKGGVGKTTIATNAALLLASKGVKVLALDLAGGLRMSRYIRKKQAEAPEKYSSIEIKEAEYEELPTSSIKNIFIGIIITAKGLAPDVERRIIDINKERIFSFHHIPIKDIILWDFESSVIEFECGDISSRIRE